MTKSYNLTLGAGRKQRHVTANVSVNFDGDYGSGSAYVIFCVGYDGKIQSTAFGHYRDELRKVDGRWFFSSRMGIIEGQTEH